MYERCCLNFYLELPAEVGYQDSDYGFGEIAVSNKTEGIISLDFFFGGAK